MVRTMYQLEVQQEAAHSKGPLKAIKKGTSYKGVNRLREIMGDSEHPGTNDSRKYRPDENKG